jgi:hypothetical protein
LRRIFTAGLTAIVAALFAAAPAQAASADSSAQGGWVPAPQGSFDLAAGARCDFAVHSEPIVDEVRKLTLDAYPDGSAKRELYAGDLILEVTNTDTGASTDVDASGTAMIDFGSDGSMTWYVVGPVLIGFRENSGTLPRGLWVIDGVFTLHFAADGYKTLTMVHGTTHNVCTDLD